MNTGECFLSIRTGEKLREIQGAMISLSMGQRVSRIVRLTFLLVGSAFALPLARADEPAVTAVLTSSETEVDRPVQLQIKVTGDNSAIPPNDITVDGLDIRYTGQSQLLEGRNLRFSYSSVYQYTILPLKAGSFTIPPQTVHTSSGTLRTPALTLNVAPNDNGSTSSGRGARGSGNQADPRKVVFCELVIPKKTAYVGEVIPIEIRLGFNFAARSGLVEPATLAGQGFTSQKMQNPDEAIRSINGQNYHVLTYRNAITPAKSGRLEITAKDAKAVVQVPRRSGNRPRSPFDLFGMDDPFNDPFFADPFNGMTEQREVKFSSEPVTIEVKPLPPNAPPTFAGAVGNFSLTTEVKPKTAQVGDPLTVTANITGRGNFDRVTAPGLESDRGWHAYPPSANFRADDDIGISGTKTFELVLTPNEPKKAVPPLLFTYFDPLKETYVTLKSEQLAVVVEGGAASTPAIASAAVSPPAAAQPTASPQPQDILYQLNEHGRWDQKFTPVAMNPAFWAAQAMPFLGLIGFFGWEMRRRRFADREEQRRAAWEHETAELQRKLRRGEDPADRYFAEAMRLVQLKTALAASPNGGIEPGSVDAETALAAFELSEEKRAQMRELFRRSDELRYSGRQNGNGVVAEQTRLEVLDLIDSLS
jgi:BatD DUF11 like domain